jgi:hypothetical protein
MQNDNKANYNTSIIVNYSTDEEYRQLINNVFHVDIPEDEYFYDNTKISQTLDDIYKKTKDNLLFQTVYKKGANLFLSTDMDLGLATMFAYSYFHLFHLLLCDYFKDTAIDETNNNYINVLNMFPTKNK